MIFINSDSTQLYNNVQNMLFFFLFFLFVDGVSGETESVMEGDSVTLHTDITEIQNDDTILWLFGPKDSVVSQITRKADFTSLFVTDDMAFRGRLHLDQKTGSLTIRNTRIRHSGQYKLTVSRQQTTTKIFIVTVFGMVGETDEVKSESVMEGKSVTLWNHVEVQRDDLIVWRFGDKGILLAKFDVETNETSLNNDDERFRDRLQLKPNGSLTIMDTKTVHTGLYELQIRGRESAQRFLLSVTAVPGLSPGVVAGIVFTVFMVFAVLAAVVIYYRRKISKLQKQMVKNVTEGESVHLHADLTEIEKDDKIQWYYEDEDENNCIAEFKADREPQTFVGADERFRGKLNLDGQTGDLIITDIRTIYSGLYILKLSNSRRTKNKRFSVSVKPKEESAVLGRSVILQPDLSDAEIETGDLILWTFGAKKSLVATNAAWPDKTDEKFRGRVKLYEKTGSLKISKITAEDAGHYKLQIITSKKTKGWRVNLILSVNVPATEGKSVILRADLTEIEKDGTIQWYYEDEDKVNLIAEFKAGGRRPDTFPGADGRFRGKLKMEKTGDLIITDIRTIYSGLYILKFSNSNSSRTKYKRFSVSVDVKKVTEGESVRLPAALTKIEKDDKIQWYYEDEDENNHIAEFKAGGREPQTFAGADGRFRGKLKMEKTGDLNITDITTIYSGLYILKFSNSRRTKCKTFNVSLKPKEESVMVGGSVTLPSDHFDAKIETDSTENESPTTETKLL